MKPLTLLILIAGTGLSIFGYWGMFTKAGNHAYDEMAGMYPFFALASGVILLLIAGIMLLVEFIKRRKRNNKVTKL